MSTPKVAIITGSSSGLGRSIAITLAVHGWYVVCSDLQPDPPSTDAIPTHAFIQQQSGVERSIFVQVDVSRSEDVQRLINTTISEFGRLDLMVNNAGISLESVGKRGSKTIWETQDDTFEQTMDVNAKSVFLGCKYAVKQFLKQDVGNEGARGWVVNIASVFGLKPEYGHVSYCASKAAVVQITKTVSKEVAPLKIHCNVVCPGFIETPMDKQLLGDPEQRAQCEALHPWGTLGQPTDIAKAILFLTSESASWVTGVVLPVDGGYMLN